MNELFGLASENFILCLARCTGYFFAAPWFGDRHVSPRLRMALSVLIAFLVAPTRPAVVGEVFSLAVLELLFGLAAGFIGKLFLAGAEAGGQLIGISMGLGFANLFDPSIGEESLPTRRLIYGLAGLAFLSIGGLEAMIRVVIVAPVTALPTLLSFYQQGGEVLAAGLRIAAPVLISALVITIASALTARAAPALNLFSLSLPILLLVGGFVLLVIVPNIVQEILFLSRKTIEVFR
jgi:flagellar biosynthesis protein FliR